MLQRRLGSLQPEVESHGSMTPLPWPFDTDVWLNTTWQTTTQTLWHSSPSTEPNVLFQISWMQLKTGSIKTHLYNTKAIQRRSSKYVIACLAEIKTFLYPQASQMRSRQATSVTFLCLKSPKIWDELNINRDQLASVNSALIFVTPDPPIMDSFSVLSDHDVAKIMHRSPSKSCEDDPIPTTLLKNTLPSVFPVLTALVNGSMQTGVFPEDLKQALVKPLLKRANLDLVDKNYCPVSNLEFVRKIIERAVTDQLTHQIAKYNLMEPMQSAYRMGHSMEMALLKGKTDILRAVDNQEVTCVVLLDLSAAFDMVDCQILINRLTSMFGISGCALTLIRSYLTGRSQRVKVGELRSDPVTLHFGVPQGSVLGPILFTLYLSCGEDLQSSWAHVLSLCR